MRITLHNFRCITGPKTYDFTDGGFSLLDAPSGSGKSTIMEAAYWALYGSMRDVYPFGIEDSKKYACVTFELDGVVVKREKPPERVTLNERGVEFTGNDAQERINIIFLSRDVWLATSYMRQGTEHPLISKPASEKFTLLHNLTFGANRAADETPDYYIDKVTDQIKSYADQATKLRGANEYIKKRFDELDKSLLQSKITWGDRPLEDQAELIAEEDEMTDEISRLEHRRRVHLELKGKRNTLHEAHNDATEALRVLEFNKDQLDPVDMKIYNKTVDDTELLRARQALEGKIHKVAMLKHVSDLSDEDRNILQIKCNAILHSKAKLGLNETNVESLVYDAEAVIESHRQWTAYTESEASRKARHEELATKAQRDHAELKVVAMEVSAHNMRVKSARREMELYNEYHALVDAAQAASDHASELKPSDYRSAAELKKKIDETKRELQALVCPKCRTGLKVSRDRLTAMHSSEERKTLESHLLLFIEGHRESQTYEEALELASRAKAKIPSRVPVKPDTPDTLKKEIHVPALRLPRYEDTPSPQGRQYSIDEANTAMLLIEEAKGFPTTDSLAALKKALDNYPVYERLKDELEMLPKLKAGTSLRALIELKDELVELQRKHAVLAAKIDTAKQHLMLAKRNLDNVPATEFDEVKFDEATNKLKAIRELIEAGKAIITLDIEREELINSDAGLQAAEEKHATAIRLRNMIEELSIDSMHSSIVSLESSTNNILKNLFDPALKISIKTTKETKASQRGGRPKFLVHIGVSYRGHEYTSLNSLSGGEINRLNLCLTLAMSDVSGSKVLFLDEVLNTLDTQLKDVAIQVIRSQATSKTIVNVCHDSVFGNYSDVVNV